MLNILVLIILYFYDANAQFNHVGGRGIQFAQNVCNDAVNGCTKQCSWRGDCQGMFRCGKDAKFCHVHCDTTGACEGLTFVSESKGDTVVHCKDEDSCRGASLTCRSAANSKSKSCQVRCNGKACFGAAVSCIGDFKKGCTVDAEPEGTLQSGFAFESGSLTCFLSSKSSQCLLNCGHKYPDANCKNVRFDCSQSFHKNCKCVGESCGHSSNTLLGVKAVATLSISKEAHIGAILVCSQPGQCRGSYRCTNPQSCVLECLSKHACKDLVLKSGNGNTVVKCSAPEACANMRVESQAVETSVNCEGYRACVNATFAVDKQGQDLKVKCKSEQSCEKARVLSEAAKATMVCESKNACEDAFVGCKDSMNFGAKCLLKCLQGGCASRTKAMVLVDKKSNRGTTMKCEGNVQCRVMAETPGSFNGFIDCWLGYPEGRQNGFQQTQCVAKCSTYEACFGAHFRCRSPQHCLCEGGVCPQMLLNTKAPSVSPTKAPTGSPTSAPTGMPTRKTGSPTGSPTVVPTRSPTGSPTDVPTGSPTKRPTNKPTTNPTKRPTNRPTRMPTSKPTGKPTRKPTKRPTDKPTMKPTSKPKTKKPTSKPKRASTTTVSKTTTTTTTKKKTTKVRTTTAAVTSGVPKATTHRHRLPSPMCFENIYIAPLLMQQTQRVRVSTIQHNYLLFTLKTNSKPVLRLLRKGASLKEPAGVEVIFSYRQQDPTSREVVVLQGEQGKRQLKHILTKPIDKYIGLQAPPKVFWLRFGPQTGVQLGYGLNIGKQVQLQVPSSKFDVGDVQLRLRNGEVIAQFITQC